MKYMKNSFSCPTLNPDRTDQPSAMNGHSSMDGHNAAELTTSGDAMHSQSNDAMSTGKQQGGSTGHHMLAPNDPENPMSWPLWRKLFTSFGAFGFAFSA